MALVDEDHTILATSSRLSDLGDMVGKKCCEIFHSQAPTPRDCAIRRAAGGQCAEEEMFDPSTGRWWKIKVVPLRSSNTKRYLHLMEDITETRGLEDGLVQIQENFRTIFDSATDAMFILEADGKVLVVNAAACAMLGKDKSDLVGHALEIFAPGGSCPLAHHAEFLTDGFARIEMPYTDSAGRTIQLEVDLRLMPLGGRGVLVTSARDISARKEAEKRMRLNEARLRALFEQAGMAIAQIDLDGRFMEVNEQFLRLTGFERRDLLGQKASILLDEKGDEEIDRTMDTLLKSDTGTLVTERLLRKRDGGQSWVRINTSVVRESPDQTNYVVSIIEDIDQGKKAEESLRRSEANYRAIVNDQTELICRFFPDGTLTFANDAYCRYFQARKEDLVGHIFIEGIPKDDREMIEDRIWLLSPSEPTITYEHTYIPLSSPARLIQWTDRAMFDAGGKVIEYQSVGRDITDRLIAQNALKKSEERFRNIVESSTDIVWEADTKGIFTFVGGQVKASLGYDPEEVLGRTPFDFVPADQKDTFRDVIDRALGSDVPIADQEIEMLNREGKRVLLELDIFQMVDNNGEIIGIRGLARDVTERKLAEKALRGSEARFRSLVQNSMDITAVLGPDGIISYISPSSLRLLGYAPEGELVGRNLFSFLHPEDIPRVRSTFDRLVQDPTSTAAPEFRLKCADGHYAYYEGVGTNLLAEPSVAGLVINARDISERKRSEEVLGRRDEILEAVSLVSERLIRGASWEENIQDVIETLGEATQVHRTRIYEMLEGDHGSKNVYLRYEWVLPSAGGGIGPRGPDGFDLRKMGLSKWEDTLLIGGVVQTNQADLHYPGRGLLESQGIQSILVVPILAGYELWGYIDLEDMVRERSWTSIEIDALRAATSILGSAILRERASRDLEMEKERLAVTLRSIADGVITTDINGDIVLMNNAAEEMLGHSQAEVEGQPVRRVFRLVKDARSSDANPVYRVLKTGQRVDMESHVILGREQARTTIEDSAAPIRDRSGKVIGAVLVFRDVTGRKAMEEELVKSQRLDSVGVLAGGIAHDFNNIMTSILGNIALAKSWCQPGDRIMDKLRETEKATLRARDLTQQLLTFSKGGAPIRQAASIAEVLHDTIDFSLSGSNVLPHDVLPADLWAVNIDPGQISQVLDNLIANSKDAMPDGGTLEITAQNVVLQEGDHPAVGTGRYVRLSMHDQGVGIPSENISKIFEPYFTTKSKGAGLGLAVVYSVIAKHEGHIDVESEVGKGTTFHILLPATSEEGVRRKEGKESIIRGEGRVLLMDDEEFILDVTGEVLRTLGYQVELARDGEEAIRMYEAARTEGRGYDAVIMDLTIPGGMGGKEAIKELLKIDPRVKAIVSSGYSSDATMADHRKFGFSGVIPKPYKIEDLSRIMSEITHGE